MKKFNSYILFFTLALLTAIQANGQGQIPLYVSTQTGEYSSYNGSGQKTNAPNEKGTISITTSGPITSLITPSNLSIGPGESKTWKGKVSPDPKNAPKPGKSDTATLIGNYSFGYVQGQVINPNDGQVQKAGNNINSKGFYTAHFIIYSLQVKFAKHRVSLCEQGLTLKTNSFPQGGKYTWTSTNGAVKLIAGADAGTVNAIPSFDYKNITGPSSDTVIVKYTLAGVNYSDTCFISLPTEITDLKDDGSHRLPRPGYVAKPGNHSPIPAQIAAAYHFTPCIYSEDSCYIDCRSIRSKCDSALLSCMLTQCRNEPNDSLKKKCTQLSAAMYKTVDEWGYRHYQAAQKEACINCKKEEDLKDKADNNKK